MAVLEDPNTDSMAAVRPAFSLRNAAGNGELLLVRHIGLGFLTTMAFTTAQAVDCA